MHEPTILAGPLVVDDKSSLTLDSIAFQKSVVSSAREEPDFRLVLRARGNKAIVLCKRDKVSVAEDEGMLGVFVFGRLF